ncbi:MAG: hypothetical protein Q9170_000501 [Blastenia crenularia]
MMKFASFETIVEVIYGYIPRKKSEYGKGVQTSVSFAGGYLAGILCAIVSHPADVMVSKLNANRQPGEAFASAMGRIYKDIGFPGLWNGLVIRIFMIGTLTSLRAGNIRPDSTPYTDGEIVREGPRGGAGNIESPRVKASNVGHSGDTDIVPETALREPGATYENYHTGRGGGGNVHKEKHEEGHDDGEHEGLGEKLKHKVLGKKD